MVLGVPVLRHIRVFQVNYQIFHSQYCHFEFRKSIGRMHILGKNIVLQESC